MKLPKPSTTGPGDFCERMLPLVSRTFALNISVLRGDLRRAVLCGYLFCRIADTVEDSTWIPGALRAELLGEYARIFRSGDFGSSTLRRWQERFGSGGPEDDEHRLLRGLGTVVEWFLTLPEADRRPVCACVVEMADGMRAAVAGPRREIATMDDLDHYCYIVAGTVGVMLTKLFTRHARGLGEKARRAMEDRAVAFGLGLQLTNIIKDCHHDGAEGRSYLPRDLLARLGVPPDGVFAHEHRAAALRALETLRGRALTRLDSALDYTLCLPRREARLRLFCLWPLLMAVKTLALVPGNEALLTGVHPVKITRRDVRTLMRASSLRVLSNGWLRRYYHALRGSAAPAA